MQAMGANNTTASLAQLQAAYQEQKEELDELEENHEEVSEQLEDALTELETTRKRHREALKKQHEATLEHQQEMEEAIVIENRLERVEDQLAAERKLRRQKEKELEEARIRNSRLWFAFSLVLFIATVATGAAMYFKAVKPRVVLVQGAVGDEGGETNVRNSTVVMGRAIPTETAKESNVNEDTNPKGTGTSTLDVAARRGSV